MKKGIRPTPEGFEHWMREYNLQKLHPPNPNPSSIEASVWCQAEQAAVEIIRLLRPTEAAELRRTNIVEYLQKLIGVDIFPFGSFPLKTYLPDGDIDLTTIGFQISVETLAFNVRTILESEAKNRDSQYEVKNVRFINAEVKLVKCMVQNFSVDISFNQIGGLSTLCFIEQVDRFIGKDHLFKRSIILIKAWCCYESHILGAQFGLISTYALETLVLYILHLFHSSLDGPLAVLYRFLDYYSKFDWDKYCISLKGPIALSSLPRLSVETIDNDGGDLLMTEEFLTSCVDSFSVPMMGSEAYPRPFIRKFLNIVDPLRENNNLGRSVNQGTFYRIRKAFEYGAQILGHKLLLPAGSIRDGVNVVFINTLGQHGVGERPDVQDVVPRLPRSALAESSGVELVQHSEPPETARADEMSSESPSSKDYRDLNKESEVIVSSKKALSHKQQNSTSGEVSCISPEHIASDAAKDLTSSRTSVIKSVTESPKTSSSTKEDGILDFRNADHPPHQFFNPESQTTRDQINSRSWGPSFNVPSASALSSDEGMQPGFCVIDSSLSNTGLDLSGDHDIHLNILNYAVWLQEKVKSGNFFPMYQSTPYSYYSHGEDVWTPGSLFTGPSPPTLLLAPVTYYPISQPFIPSSNNAVHVPRPRGTGAYFPNVTYQACRETYFPRRVDYSRSADHPLMLQSNLQADIPQDMSSMDNGSNEAASLSEIASGKLPAWLDMPSSSPRHASNTSPEASKPADFGTVQFGTFGPVSLGTPTKEPVRKSPISRTQGSGYTSPASSSHRLASTSTSTSIMETSDKERTPQPYQMRDEDFPPLSG